MKELNGYICYCTISSTKIEIYAESLYEAKEKALETFQSLYPRRKIKSFQVSAHLAEKNGAPITHVADF